MGLGAGHLIRTPTIWAIIQPLQRSHSDVIFISPRVDVQLQHGRHDADESSDSAVL